MRHTVKILALATLFASAGAAHAGTVDVSFIEPDKFVDAGRGLWDVEQTTKTLAEYFKRYAKQLPEGQALKVEVTDVDLAGELRPTRGAQEIRVLRGRADWPRISLRYSLTEGGRVLRGGESKVDDMSYMMHPLRGGQTHDALAYERRMLDAWFRQTIVGTPVASR